MEKSKTTTSEERIAALEKECKQQKEYVSMYMRLLEKERARVDFLMELIKCCDIETISLSSILNNIKA